MVQDAARIHLSIFLHLPGNPPAEPKVTGSTDHLHGRLRNHQVLAQLTFTDNYQICRPIYDPSIPFVAGIQLQRHVATSAPAIIESTAEAQSTVGSQSTAGVRSRVTVRKTRLAHPHWGQKAENNLLDALRASQLSCDRFVSERLRQHRSTTHLYLHLHLSPAPLHTARRPQTPNTKFSYIHTHFKLWCRKASIGAAASGHCRALCRALCYDLRGCQQLSTVVQRVIGLVQSAPFHVQRVLYHVFFEKLSCFSCSV